MYQTYNFTIASIHGIPPKCILSLKYSL